MGLTAAGVALAVYVFAKRSLDSLVAYRLQTNTRSMLLQVFGRGRLR